MNTWCYKTRITQAKYRQTARTSAPPDHTDTIWEGGGGVEVDDYQGWNRGGNSHIWSKPRGKPRFSQTINPLLLLNLTVTLFRALYWSLHRLFRAIYWSWHCSDLSIDPDTVQIYLLFLALPLFRALYWSWRLTLFRATTYWTMTLTVQLSIDPDTNTVQSYLIQLSIDPDTDQSYLLILILIRAIYWSWYWSVTYWSWYWSELPIDPNNDIF